MTPMKKYCIKCNKYRKFVNLKIYFFFDKILILSIIYSNCGDNNNRIFEEKKSIEMSKILGLIN